MCSGEVEAAARLAQWRDLAEAAGIEFRTGDRASGLDVPLDCMDSQAEMPEREKGGKVERQHAEMQKCMVLWRVCQ